MDKVNEEKIRPEYLNKLKNDKEANEFLSQKESEKALKELKQRAKELVRINYKPGLVLNTRYNNFFSNTIATGLGCYFTHTAWVREVTDDKVYIQEALGSKTKRVSSTWYTREHFDKLFTENKLEVLDFGIEDDINFKLYCAEMEGMPYDYFAILELAVSRLITLFGFSAEGFLHSRWLSKWQKMFNKDYTTAKKVDCSELIARGISRLKMVKVLEILGKDKYEFVTPQMISVLYMKINTKKIN